MLRIAIALIIFLHGAIHLMGFAKAFSVGNITGLTKDISKPLGLVWLVTALLFVFAGIIFLTRNGSWWMPAALAVLLSQYLVFTFWGDARFGTIANIILLIAVILSYGSWKFERGFTGDVLEADNLMTSTGSMVTEKDLNHLPKVVQDYLRYVGVVNRPAVSKYYVRFSGEMREKGKDWFQFHSEQFNYTATPTRLFFMKAKMTGITVPGYHAYKNGSARMQVKIFGLFPVVNEGGGILDRAETVTIFNDMCLLAPASLIDPSIEWEAIGDTAAKARFRVKDIVIAATLIFNKSGQLINFISDDRYAIGERKQYRFSTPVGQYKKFNGFNLPAYGEAVWHYPEGEFAYGRFRLQEVHYD